MRCTDRIDRARGPTIERELTIDNCKPCVHDREARNRRPANTHHAREPRTDRVPRAQLRPCRPTVLHSRVRNERVSPNLTTSREKWLRVEPNFFDIYKTLCLTRKNSHP